MSTIAKRLREIADTELEAAPAADSAMPAYGTIPWDALVAAVGEAQGSQFGVDPTYYVGHQMCVINMNSLNRIVSKFVATAQVQAAVGSSARALLGAEREAMPCGHHPSLMLKSAETGADLYCELCDAKSGRSDAEQMESAHLSAIAALQARIAELAAENERWAKECNDRDDALSERDALRAKVAELEARQVTEAMITTYLEANDAYWIATDEIPRPPGKWRTGTPREATRVSLIAALTAAPSKPTDPEGR